MDAADAERFQMPVETRFMFTTGVKEPMVVPRGTLLNVQTHVKNVEQSLGLVAERYLDNPPRWRTTTPSAEVSDATYCRVARKHEDFLDWFWESLAKWHETPPTGDTEVLTPEDAATFWHGLQRIEVPVERWDREHCLRRMKEMYEIMRGRPTRGFCIDAKPLSPEQAGGILWLVGEFLRINPHDLNMAVPKEWCRDRKSRRAKLVQLDEAQPSNGYDGDGYEWCERCGAVATDSVGNTDCPRRKCPIKRDY